MNKKQQTINTYNRGANIMAVKFNDLGGYPEDIKDVFSRIQKKNPNVIEIGCGNGRDAEEIFKYTKNYLGIDISQSFIEIAKNRNPGSMFKVADVENYEFEDNIDIIFAFASFVHISKESLSNILGSIYSKLNCNGIVLATIKYNNYYKEFTKEDEFGKRTYYLYTQDDIKNIAENFKILKNDIYDLRGQKWIKLILQKA